ncbi:MIR motif-containing protein, partial [Chytriomyces sp. MP71]
QLAMVESPFLLCNGLALLFWLRFMGTSATAFSKAWWPPLLLAGIFLGLSMSSKWSTLFLVASFCLVAMQDLWSLASDRLFSPSTILRHVFARILCLVVIPSVIYVGVFWIHFALLSSTGNGAKYMTPEVQVSLKGAKNPEFFANVSYGSYISLRHEASPCGYVTSGSSRYLKGSQMHTVWCGAKDDSSAMFSIEHRYIMNSGGIENPPTHPEELLKDGDIIRLKHTNTLRWLRSHDFRPALQNNTAQSEVCTHGDPKTSDFDDLWQIETAPRNAPVRAMQTRLRLVHFQRKCSLMSRTFKNGSYSEVSCVQNKERVGTVWRIEGNRNPKYPAGAQKIRYKPAGFWSKFMETQRHMLETFSNTTRTHPYVSNPLDWPIARRGVAVWHDPKSPAQIFVLGNPVVSIATTGSVVLCVIFVAVLWVAAQRHVPLSNATIEQLTSAEQILVLVFCNYVPFFFAKTELFLHDGFPALYAAFLCVGLIFDAFTLRFRSPSRIVMAGVLVACVLFAFVKWSALTYGFPMSVEQCEGLKWRKAWDWFCREAPEGSTRPSAAAFP